MKTPDEQPIPVEAGREKYCQCDVPEIKILSGICHTCNKPVTIKPKGGDEKCDNVTAEAILQESITHGVTASQTLPPAMSSDAPEETKGAQLPPRIQRVIDAARVYMTNIRARYPDTNFDDDFNALESALAALGTEPTKDDPYPHHYVDSRGKGYQVNSAEHEAGALRLNHKRVSLTAAEAQARMEGKAREPLVDKLEVLITTISDDVLSQDWEYNSNHRQLITDILRRHLKAVPPPAQDELQVLLERVNGKLKTFEGIILSASGDARVETFELIQRWIEDAMKGRRRSERA